jgi:hypothetical protein
MDVQAIGEAFSPQKRTNNTSKNLISQLFSIFMGYFCPHGSGSEILVPIRRNFRHLT